MPIFILVTMTVVFLGFNGFLYLNAPHFVITPSDLALITFFELGAIVGVCWLAVAFAHTRARPLALVIALAMPPIIALAYLAQAYSGYLTSDFLSVMAIENSTELRYVMDYRLLAAVIAVPLAWFAAAWVLLSRRRVAAVAPGLVLSIITGAAWWTVQQDSHWESPLRALITTAQSAYGQPPNVALDADLSKGYPFMQQGLEVAALDWMPAAANPPNVILVLAEGLSTRALGSYNGAYPDLTPNIDAFAERSMRVERFFNHTAATFRGLQGILTSGYPYHGGYSSGGWVTGQQGTIDRLSAIRYASLPRILQSHGYQTTFISPHSNANPLNDMLRALDFATVYALDDYPDYLEGSLNPHPDIAGAAVDQDLFRMTCAWLQEAGAEAEAPFFLSLYNIGTHAFTDIPPAPINPGAQHYADGSNAALNRLHDFDRVWGGFLDCFDRSDRADNTILIFSTDHAMFHDPLVIEAFGDDPSFNRYFVDEIPLIIHAPQWELPETWDARNASSIALAPSLLHLLGFTEDAHAFLGRSIFSRAHTDAPPISMAALGDQLFYIGDWGVAAEPPKKFAEEFASETDRIHAYYQLERQNRIFSN